MHGRNEAATEVLIIRSRDKMPSTKSGRKNNINIRKLVPEQSLVVIAVALLLAVVFSNPVHAIEIKAPAVSLSGVPMDYSVSGVEPGVTVELSAAGKLYNAAADDQGVAEFSDLVIETNGQTSLHAKASEAVSEKSIRVIPAWVSVLPAVIAIAIALTLRNVIPALLLGLWLGATALHSFTFKGAGIGLLDTFQVFVRGIGGFGSRLDRPFYDDDRWNGRHYYAQWRNGQYCARDRKSSEDGHRWPGRCLVNGPNDLF